MLAHNGSLIVIFVDTVESVCLQGSARSNSFFDNELFIYSSGQIVNDLKFTVNHAVEPVEKGFTRFNEKLHKISQNIKKHGKEKRTKDDSCIGSSSSTRKVIRGIDDPLLMGSFSDSGAQKGRRHRKKSGYTSAGSGGESSSDHGHGHYEVRGGRWITKV